MLTLYISDYQSRIAATHGLLQAIGDMVHEKNASILPYLTHVNASLSKILLTLKAAEKSDPSSSDQSLSVLCFEEKNKIAPGTKNETQLMFARTTKKAGRKRKQTTLK